MCWKCQEIRAGSFVASLAIIYSKVFDGSHKVAMRLTVQPGLMRARAASTDIRPVKSNAYQRAS
jgi:hypothetical protein